MLKRSTGVELLFEKQIRTTGRLFCRCTGGLGGLDVGYSLFFLECFTVFEIPPQMKRPQTSNFLDSSEIENCSIPHTEW